MKKKVTIQDIADTVGYSKTTVSRYLNGQTHMMSTETANRIKNVIELLDYHPSDLARSLKTKKFYTVGIVISDISSPFAASVIAASGEVLEANGYVPFFINCHEDPRKEEHALSTLVSKGVDGLIINTTSPDNNFIYEYVNKGLPIVLCDRKLKNYNMDIVEVDNKQIIATLVRHLKDQGYTRLALFTQDNIHSSAKDIRTNHFLDTVSAYFGYDASKDIYQIRENDVENTRQELEKFMATVRDGEIPAVIGASTIVTMLLYRAIKMAGYIMPDHLGLCGTNAWSWNESITWTELLHPSITCVVLHGHELGQQCAHRILEKISGPYSAPENIKINVELQIRESTLRGN